MQQAFDWRSRSLERPEKKARLVRDQLEELEKSVWQENPAGGQQINTCHCNRTPVVGHAHTVEAEGFWSGPAQLSGLGQRFSTGGSWSKCSLRSGFDWVLALWAVPSKYRSHIKCRKFIFQDTKFCLKVVFFVE